MLSDRYETGKGQSRKITPRQKMYLANYNDPTSPTFSNALQSALNAGYSQTYAESMTVAAQRNEWTESGKDLYSEMLEKAEKNLNKIVDMPETEYKENAQVMKIWKDTNTFVSERLGKEKWSSRQEVTGKDGRRIFSNEDKSTASMPLTALFKGTQAPVSSKNTDT